MSSSPRIPKAELTGLYGAMVKRMSRKMFGEVPEPIGVAWHNRKVLNFSFSVGPNSRPDHWGSRQGVPRLRTPDLRPARHHCETQDVGSEG